MKYKYLVQCWITPRSGFDLARKSRITELFRALMRDTFDSDEKLEQSIKKFEESHNGLILEPLVIESDTEVKDPEKEFLDDIHAKYPEAKIFSIERMPEFINT